MDRGFRVLIIDGSHVNRIILRKRLNSIIEMGLNIFEVVECADMEEGILLFSDQGGDFGLVLIDSNISIESCSSVTMNIHKKCDDICIPRVPVIALLSSICRSVHANCYNSGMDYIVTKPYSKSELLDSILYCFRKVKV
jgi:CheY-like chemotaxis protein